MKIVIRLLSITVALIVIGTIFLIVDFLGKSSLLGFLKNGWFSYLTLIGWVLTFTIGPYATIQLWRLRESGLLATASLCLFAICYYSAGAYLAHSPDMTAIIIKILINTACLIFVLLPKVKKYCNSERTA